MASQLVIVESPSKAKTIQKYLGRDYQVEASYGHIRDLPESGKNAINIEADFAMTYEVPDKKRNQVAKLRKAARGAKVVWLATDKDREGEAIAWHLMDELNLPPERVRRVTFNEITKKAIQAAFSQPGEIDLDKVAAQETRRALDRLVGYPVSDLVRKKIPGARSAGRVQTVAVRLIVEREREIRAFVAQEYGRIGAVLIARDKAAGALTAYESFMTAHRTATAEGQPPPSEAETASEAATEAASEGSSETPANVVAAGGLSPAARRELDTLLGQLGAFRAELVSLGDQRLAITAEAVKEARGLVLSEARAAEIVAALRGADFTVASVETRERLDRPRPPFTTATLQQAASSQLRFPASKTMRLAQQLYEGVDLTGEGPVALITYMRTDSTFLSDQAIEEGRGYIARRFGESALPERPNHYAPKASAQGAHEAIRPTEPARDPQSLADRLERDMLALYRLIWTRFTAGQMRPAVWNVTEVNITARSLADPGPVATLRAGGRQLKSAGYTALTGLTGEGEPLLPALAAGDALADLDVAASRHATQPPPRFTEAGLVRELERQGIGRPSTYATIIQTIQDRNYVREHERKFVPTLLGEVVTDALVARFAETFNTSFTSEMENRLDEIESGQLQRPVVLAEFWNPFKTNLETAEAQMPHFAGRQSQYTCQKCQAPMVYQFNRKEGNPFLGCSRFPQCENRQAVDDLGQPRAPSRETQYLCEKCGRPMVLRSTNLRGRASHFLGCSGYSAEPQCTNTRPCNSDGQPLEVLSSQKVTELDLRCTACGKGLDIKQGRFGAYLGCQGYPECKQIEKLPAGYYVPRPQPTVTGILCDLCGKPLAVRSAGPRKFLGCTGYPKCRNAKPYELFESGYTGVAPKSVPREDQDPDSDDPADTNDQDAPESAAAKRGGKSATAKATKKAAAKTAKVAKAPKAKSSTKTAKVAKAPKAKSSTKTAKRASRDAPPADAADDHEGVFTAAGREVPTQTATADGSATGAERLGQTARSAEAGVTVSGTKSRAQDREPAGVPFDPDPPGAVPVDLGLSRPLATSAKRGGSSALASPMPDAPTEATPGDIGQTDSSWGVCQACGRPLVVKPGKWGPFLGCSGYPKCKTIVSLKGEAKQRAAAQAGAPPPKPAAIKTDVPCPQCGAALVIRRGRSGRFLGCSNYPKCTGTLPMTPELEALADTADKG